MVRLTDLEVYNSIFNIHTTNNKFDLYTNTFDEFSFEELKDELEEILKTPNITDDNLEDKITAERVIKSHWELRSENSRTDGYILLKMGYARSAFRDFESYLRMLIGLDEDDIQLILKQNNEKFVTYELHYGNYTFEDNQKAVYPLGDHERTLQIEYDDLNKNFFYLVLVVHLER